MIKHFLSAKNLKEGFLLMLCVGAILCAAIFVWYTQANFEENLVNSFYEEQTNHAVLVSNLLKGHMEEAHEDLYYIIDRFIESESQIAKKRNLDDFLINHPKKFKSLSLINPDGEILAFSGAFISNKNFFEYVEVEKKEEFTNNLDPFISERIIRDEGYPSTFIFVPFLLSEEQLKPYFLVGELSLKDFIEDKLEYINDKEIFFVMTDDDGDIYGIINVEHDDVSQMERGNLYNLPAKCSKCHTETSFDSFKQANRSGEATHSLYKAPGGDLFYRTVAVVKVFNEEWLVSITQPHSRIQGQISKNFWSNAFVLFLLLMCSIIGAYAFYRISQREALEGQYTDLVNSLNVGIVRLSESGEIINMNLAMFSLLELEQRRIESKLSFLNFFVHNTDWHKIISLLKRTTSTAEGDFWLLKRGGNTFIAAFSMNGVKSETGEILYIDGVIQDVTEKKLAEDKLEETNRKLEILSITDGLTELANRRCFDELLVKEYDRHSRSGDKLSLILLDIDCFKPFNDSYGHIAGDKCLKQIAQVLASCTSRPSDFTARYGGEEFVCLLPSTDISGAIIVAEKIRSDIENLAVPHKASKVADYVTASLGVVSVQCSHDGSSKDMLELADKLLYRAKASGRNRVERDI